MEAGITEILLVTGGNHAGDFLRLLGNGKDFGLKHLNYTYQEGEGGIAAALALREHFADGEPTSASCLGTTSSRSPSRPAVEKYGRRNKGATVLLAFKEVPDPERFGVPVLEGERIVRDRGEAEAPRSRYAVIGVYLYDARVFDIIKTLKPSGRGELEITDVNNQYLEHGAMEADVVDGLLGRRGRVDRRVLRGERLRARRTA